MTGAAIVFKALEEQGVDTIFGYPGGAVLPIYDELKNHKKIRHFLVRHEQRKVTLGHQANLVLFWLHRVQVLPIR